MIIWYIIIGIICTTGLIVGLVIGLRRKNNSKTKTFSCNPESAMCFEDPTSNDLLGDCQKKCQHNIPPSATNVGCDPTTKQCVLNKGSQTIDQCKQTCHGPLPNPPTSCGKAGTYNCSGGWPTCQGVPGQKPGGGITTDPCLTYPDGDITDNSQRYPTGDWTPAKDNEGNVIQNPSEWYFGRGLIQLTWSCNYLKTQVSLRQLLDNIKSQKDTFRNDLKTDVFKKVLGNQSADNILDQIGKVSICRDPSILCGNYTMIPNSPTITYSESIVDQAIPWLACIIYWAENINISSDWWNNYSFLSALSGIGPSGSADAPKRVAFSLLFAFMMGLTSENMNIPQTKAGAGIGNICLRGAQACQQGSTSTGKVYQTPLSWDPKAGTTISCSQCDSQICTGSSSTQAPWTGPCPPSQIDKGGWGQVDIPCKPATPSPSLCSTCLSPSKICPGSGGSTQKSKVPFKASAATVFQKIMDLKSSTFTVKDVFAQNDKTMDLLTKQQKADILYSDTPTQDQTPNTYASYFMYALNCKISQSDNPLKKYAFKSDNPVNPMYTWEGLAFAAYLWNLGAATSTNLRKYGGFCASDWDDDTGAIQNKLTLAIFLGNAVVESANFLVCQESILNCEDYSRRKDCFQSRYFDNCDNANPYTYSCQCSSDPSGPGGGGGPAVPCGTPSCDACKDGCKTCGGQGAWSADCKDKDKNISKTICDGWPGTYKWCGK